jgi:hypothetical protein
LTANCKYSRRAVGVLNAMASRMPHVCSKSTMNDRVKGIVMHYLTARPEKRDRDGLAVFDVVTSYMLWQRMLTITFFRGVRNVF